MGVQARACLDLIARCSRTWRRPRRSDRSSGPTGRPVPGCSGIGVSAGTVVAGNVGDRRRYEYAVIGDPVNEAARLTEHAKKLPGRIAASDRVIARAAPPEASHRHQAGTVTCGDATSQPPSPSCTPTPDRQERISERGPARRRADRREPAGGRASSHCGCPAAGRGREAPRDPSDGRARGRPAGMCRFRGRFGILTMGGAGSLGS
jgi:Adenylate and Guanylate cyclase catalytic domain